MASIPLRSRQPAAAFFPDLLAPDILHSLALAAVDAARSAGAEYADVRIGDLRVLRLGIGEGGLVGIQDLIGDAPSGSIAYELSYGIRARVGGAWASVFGNTCTLDAITASAREAAATVRSLAPVIKQPWTMVPAPVAKGEWTTPIQIDPFAASPDEHVNLLGAFYNAACRTPDGDVWPNVTWTGETRVFASSEGALTTQHFTRASPTLSLTAKTPLMVARDIRAVTGRLPQLAPTSAGLEILLGPALQETIKAAIVELTALLRLPTTTAQVGRYEAVFDGASLGTLAAYTLAPAVELRRALGYDADGDGTSFLSPPQDVLGQPLFSPQLTMTADRSMPHYNAAQWDDEGVSPQTFPLIKNGAVVDYFTTRATAGALASWYQKTGQSVVSRGSAMAIRPRTAPTGRASELTIASGAPGMTMDSLVRHVKNGLLVRSMEYITTDPQLNGGAFFPDMLFEIKNGVVTRRVLKAAVQFGTKHLWKNMTTVGDASTLDHGFSSRYISPEVIATVSVRAPAAQFAQLDVIQRQVNE